jgi:hypothetical protein
MTDFEFIALLQNDSKGSIPPFFTRFSNFPVERVFCTERALYEAGAYHRYATKTHYSVESPMYHSDPSARQAFALPEGFRGLRNRTLYALR